MTFFVCMHDTNIVDQCFNFQYREWSSIENGILVGTFEKSKKKISSIFLKIIVKNK